MTTTDEILKTLNQYHTAQENHDLDEMLGAYAPDGFVDLSEMQGHFQELIDRDAFRERTIDMTECEIYIYRDKALVRPVVYHTQQGKRFILYHLSKGDNGTWRIIDSNRSQSIYDGCFGSELAAHAGKVVGMRGMLWMRRLSAPIEDYNDPQKLDHGLKWIRLSLTSSWRAQNDSKTTAA